MDYKRHALGPASATTVAVLPRPQARKNAEGALNQRPQRVCTLRCGGYANNFNNGFPFTNSLG